MAGKEGKRKRDRDHDGSAKQPKKKVAVQTDSEQAQFNTVKVASMQVESTCPPIIATHPGLCLPSSVTFQAYTKNAPSKSKKAKIKHAASSSSSLMLHSSSHSKLDYTAREEGPGGRESHLKHYIGVFDPATGELSVVEARKMAVRGVVRSQQPKEEDVQSRMASKNMMELRSDLGQAFGTKKAKKALAAITENAIVDNEPKAKSIGASSQAMMSAIGEVTNTMASKEDLQAAADAAKPVPPGNFEAREIQDVYTPQGMIGGELLNAIPIKDWQDAVKKGANKMLTSAFIASRLNAVGEGPDSATRLKALRYLEFLIKFSKLAKGRAGKLPPPDKLRQLLHPAPEPVLQSIRRKFSSNQLIDKFHRDLLYTYCCALAAILSNFEFETSKIRFDLGLDDKQFGQYFREIGGKVKKATGAEKGTQIQMAVLSLPLEFPKVRYQRPTR
ncbi:RNA polymerase I associated factor, A49-like protein [Xylaria bambusicola]|uniref:RNA polymerase I associated factor, A49-like protein n=1 Tax=Xylaria bambusicola TaxID=326684 RepID=UPI00200768A1|nr:RNA polymerase I associated factor, A49-like protein [Xylaria bambusicola]KAI0512621.1 RNA polymerase I associated factor, A49-like protein [Xylaria bambusicola]